MCAPRGRPEVLPANTEEDKGQCRGRLGIGRARLSAVLANQVVPYFSIVDESVRAGKPKWRLTTDLSWPHSGAMIEGGIEVDAVNQAMDRSD